MVADAGVSVGLLLTNSYETGLFLEYPHVLLRRCCSLVGWKEYLLSLVLVLEGLMA